MGQSAQSLHAPDLLHGLSAFHQEPSQPLAPRRRHPPRHRRPGPSPRPGAESRQRRSRSREWGPPAPGSSVFVPSLSGLGLGAPDRRRGSGLGSRSSIRQPRRLCSPHCRAGWCWTASSSLSARTVFRASPCYWRVFSSRARGPRRDLRRLRCPCPQHSPDDSERRRILESLDLQGPAWCTDDVFDDAPKLELHSRGDARAQSSEGRVGWCRFSRVCRPLS
jgi:hypothetical protein